MSILELQTHEEATTLLRSSHDLRPREDPKVGSPPCLPQVREEGIPVLRKLQVFQVSPSRKIKGTAITKTSTQTQVTFFESTTFLLVCCARQKNKDTRLLATRQPTRQCLTRTLCASLVTRILSTKKKGHIARNLWF